MLYAEVTIRKGALAHIATRTCLSRAPLSGCALARGSSMEAATRLSLYRTRHALVTLHAEDIETCDARDSPNTGRQRAMELANLKYQRELPIPESILLRSPS